MKILLIVHMGKAIHHACVEREERELKTNINISHHSLRLR